MKINISLPFLALALIGSSAYAITPSKQDVRKEISGSSSVALYRVVSGECLEFLRANGCKRTQLKLSIDSRIKGAPKQNTTIINVGTRSGGFPLGSMVLGYENTHGQRANKARPSFMLLPVADISIGELKERVVVLNEEEVAPGVIELAMSRYGSSDRTAVIFSENTGRNVMRVAPLDDLLK